MMVDTPNGTHTHTHTHAHARTHARTEDRATMGNRKKEEEMANTETDWHEEQTC